MIFSVSESLSCYTTSFTHAFFFIFELGFLCIQINLDSSGLLLFKITQLLKWAFWVSSVLDEKHSAFIKNLTLIHRSLLFSKLLMRKCVWYNGLRCFNLSTQISPLSFFFQIPTLHDSSSASIFFSAGTHFQTKLIKFKTFTVIKITVNKTKSHGGLLPK